MEKNLIETAFQQHQAGNLDAAAATYKALLEKHVENIDALFLLGTLHLQRQEIDDACELLRRALVLKPDHAMAQNNLGTVLKSLGKFDEAAECYRNALALKPHYAEAHNNLGTVFLEQKKLHEAVNCYNVAIKLKPDYTMAYSNLGTAWRELGKLDSAIESCIRAIEVDPDYAEAHNNLGTSLQETGRVNEAVTSFKRATSLKPDYALAHVNSALALLLAGNFKDGWDEYEWRLLIRKHIPQTLAKPLWDGSPLNGKSILVHVEQGFGDTIQFARYLSMVKARGGRVIFECQKELICILRGCSGIDEFIEYVQPCKPAVPFDTHISLLSLPRIFETTLETVPVDIAYIKVDSALCMKWGLRFRNNSDLKIGIAWSGSPRNTNDRNRSCTLKDFAILGDIPHITFYSLQKGAAAVEASQPPEGMNIVNLERELRDFADTAAVIANLDLVISVDTVVVHLAGAMGKAVWNLLPFAPAWRWLQERDESPWYPTMRLFRQSHPNDWFGVFQQVKGRLHDLL